MRIAYIVGRYPSPSETFITREIEALEALGAGIEVFPLWRGPGAPPSPSERPVHWVGHMPFSAPFRRPLAAARWKWYFLVCLPREGWGALRAVWRLASAFAVARRLRALGIERVHAHFGSLPSTVGWVAASLARLPFSFAVHARDVFVEPQFLASKARAADHIIACNSAVAARAAELVAAADRPKIELIPHGLPLERYPFRREAPTGEPLVLGVGRLVEKKGFVHLVRAMGHLRAKGANATCWLIGEGPERKALSREIEALGLGGTVVLRGWMPHEDVMGLYERAALLVAPSVVARDGDRDGLPNVVVEAAAKGLPIVATDVGGLGDLVRDGETGLVARPGDAEDLAETIALALKEAEDVGARARRARAEIEARFDQARCAQRLLDALGAPSGR